MEKFKASEVDFMGIFKLQDAKGIENLVSKVKGSDHYLSRNSQYYGRMMTETCSEKRKRLSQLLPLEGKKGFVVAENMANLSAKVLHSELSNGGDVEAAKVCLDEDVANLLSVMDGKYAQKTEYKLPQSKDRIAQRPIEQDNKKLLKMVVSSLPKHKQIVTPGLGGIYIGAFSKAIHGANYDLINYSLYDNGYSHAKRSQLVLGDFVDPKVMNNLNNDIILFDDNVATGRTMQKIKNLFQQEGINVKTGAVQFFWELYDLIRSYAGKETDGAFKVGDFDFVSAITYNPVSINNGIVKQLKISSENYATHVKNIGYHSAEITDDLSMMRKGLKIMEKHGIDLSAKSNKVSSSTVEFNNKLQREVLLNS